MLSLPALPVRAAPGMCTIVDSDLFWLHVLSDVAIGLAYISIPVVLLVMLQRRRDLPYPWLFGLFAAFILACGATHLMHAFTMFQPAPMSEGLLKAATAAISVATAITLWPVLPRLLALRSPAALAREVEERRAAETRALASEARALNSEARTATVLANLSDAVFVLRPTPEGGFRIETVNAAFERLFGVPAAEVAGAPAESVMPAPALTQALPRWREAVARGETLEYEITADLQHGRLTWQTVLVPLRGPDGRIERLLGSARDVTATRRLQAGLVQSARLATVGTICAGLAHEASQPLNTAGLWLRRLREAVQLVPAERQASLARAAAVVEDQLRRAGDLVARIRALAGDESGGAERFDAGGPVRAALRTASAQYAPDRITVALRDPGKELLVRGNPARLEQAVLQLLANARDAVLERRRAEPDAPARIELALSRESGWVAIEVRDSGTGIAEEAQESLFDPFFTTKEPGRGTGLGLALAANVARGMGGGMAAWNLPGGGACFRMEVAAVPDGSAAPPPGRLAVA